MRTQYNVIFNFIRHTCDKFAIDDSHGLKHSMDVFKYSQRILKNEVVENPHIQKYERIIYTSALLHDMCDNKYMDEDEGLIRIRTFITTDLEYSPAEIDAICNIISTMSYSKVKKNGFPSMGEFQPAYHIVRESDLLTAYDIDRCIVFNMNRYEIDYIQSITDACNLYDVRMKKHIDDNLFTTKTGLEIAKKLVVDSDERVIELNEINK